MNWLKSVLIVSLVVVALPAFAKQKTYTVTPSEKNTVKFTSDAPIEVINGNTHDINGKISYDDSFKFDAKHPFKISFDVDLKTFDTGIPLRNEHMRDNFLETAKYPKGTFEVTGVAPSANPPFKAGQVVTINSTGQFTVHGKTVSKNIPVQVTYHPGNVPGDTIRVQAKFPIKLDEHGIQRPEVVFQKLAETIFVNVDAYGVASADTKIKPAKTKK